MNFSKVIMLGMMLVTLSMFVYVSAIAISPNYITGKAATPVCPEGADCSGGVAYCGDGICNNGETCQTCLRDCPQSDTCTVNLSQFDEDVHDNGDDFVPLNPPCSDGTPYGACSIDSPGMKCQGRLGLVPACSYCRCGAGDACYPQTQECLRARSCEDASALCLFDETCPQNTTALPQFNRYCNLVPIGLPSSLPKICCWPNQEYWEGLGSNYANVSNQTATQDLYDKLRQELGICSDQSNRDSCNAEGLYCNSELQLVQDCSKCGCGQGFLCYEKKCVSPEEYDRLAFFNDVLQLSPIERILVEKPQQEVFDISNTYSPGEYAQSFSPLYSGAQDVVPSLSKSTSSDKRTVLLSGIVPQRDNDRFEVAISVVNNRPKIDLKFGS